MKVEAAMMCSSSNSAGSGELRAPKGYVPVLVGSGNSGSERFLVPVKAFKHPSFSGLLEMASQEFGYKQKGVLRIPCDAQQFRRVLEVIAEI